MTVNMTQLIVDWLFKKLNNSKIYYISNGFLIVDKIFELK